MQNLLVVAQQLVSMGVTPTAEALVDIWGLHTLQNHVSLPALSVLLATSAKSEIFFAYLRQRLCFCGVPVYPPSSRIVPVLSSPKCRVTHTLSGVLSREGDVLTILKDYISAKAGIFADDVATLRLYFAETRGASFNIKAGLDQDIRKLYDELVEQLASTLEKGIRKNVLRDLNPYYMAVALEGITNAFLFCWLEDPERHSYKANAPVISDMFLKGVMAE